MPDSAGSTTLDVGAAGSSNQLASLIPTFDPSTDSVEQCFGVAGHLWTYKLLMMLLS